MIPELLHLLACIALVVAALYWKRNLPPGLTFYRRLLPFILSAGILGIIIFFRYGMEFFVASYSGAIYELEEPSRTAITAIAISVIVSALPLVGLLPIIGGRASAMICIGCIAAIPSLYTLLPRTHKPQTEQSKQPPTSLSVSMILSDYNLNPGIDTLHRW